MSYAAVFSCVRGHKMKCIAFVCVNYISVSDLWVTTSASANLCHFFVIATGGVTFHLQSGRFKVPSSLPEPYPLSLRFQVFSNRSFPYHLYKADMQSQQTELRWQAASAAERLTFFSRHVRCCLFLLSRRQRCHRSRRETQAADGEALADGQLSLTIWWEALEFSPRVALFL